jgi:S-(hydroxymethyl)glutathione dehydrogenase/alcohol dehydrogenase
MRAALLESLPGRPVIADVDVDEPAANEVAVRIVACGVCHSDVHVLRGSRQSYPLPFVLGHEPAGVVEAVGPGVRHLQPGDHVVACLAGFCGHCVRCVTGDAHRCANRHELARPSDAPPRLRRGEEAVQQFVGLSGFAERLLFHQHSVVRIDPALPLERACILACGVVTGAGAVWNTAGVTDGETVAVIGAGGVGLSAVQAARVNYASRIVAVDVDDEKLELARRCGATDVVNATRDDPVAAVHAIVPGGVDHSFEAIGRASTAQQALAMIGRGGTCTIIGVLDPAESLTVGSADLMMGKTVRQSLMGSARFVVDIERLVTHALAGRFDLDGMISSERSLDELPTALDDVDAGRVLGRTVITF